MTGTPAVRRLEVPILLGAEVGVPDPVLLRSVGADGDHLAAAGFGEWWAAFRPSVSDGLLTVVANYLRWSGVSLSELVDAMVAQPDIERAEQLVTYVLRSRSTGAFGDEPSDVRA